MASGHHVTIVTREFLNLITYEGMPRQHFHRIKSWIYHSWGLGVKLEVNNNQNSRDEITCILSDLLILMALWFVTVKSWIFHSRGIKTGLEWMGVNDYQNWSRNYMVVQCFGEILTFLWIIMHDRIIVLYLPDVVHYRLPTISTMITLKSW